MGKYRMSTHISVSMEDRCLLSVSHRDAEVTGKASGGWRSRFQGPNTAPRESYGSFSEKRGRRRCPPPRRPSGHSLPRAQPLLLILQNPPPLASSLAPRGCWQSHLESDNFFLKRSGRIVVMLIICGTLIVAIIGLEWKQRPSQVAVNPSLLGPGSRCVPWLLREDPRLANTWEMGSGPCWGLTSRGRELRPWAE